MRAERANCSVKLLPKQIDQVFIGCAPGSALDDQAHRSRSQRVLADDVDSLCQLRLCFVPRDHDFRQSPPVPWRYRQGGRDRRAIVLTGVVVASHPHQLRHPKSGVVSQAEQRRIAQAGQRAGASLQQRDRGKPLGRCTADVGTKPHRPGLTLRDIDPAPESAQGIAHDQPPRRARRPQQPMHHREARETSPARRRLELPPFAIFKVGDDARRVRVQANAARGRAKGGIAGKIVGQRLDARGSARLEALRKASFSIAASLPINTASSVVSCSTRSLARDGRSMGCGMQLCSHPRPITALCANATIDKVPLAIVEFHRIYFLDCFNPDSVFIALYLRFSILICEMPKFLKPNQSKLIGSATPKNVGLTGTLSPHGR